MVNDINKFFKDLNSHIERARTKKALRVLQRRAVKFIKDKSNKDKLIHDKFKDSIKNINKKKNNLVNK